MKSLNLKHLSAAVVLALAGTGVAHAAPETIASTPAFQLYISGAGEEDQILEQSIARVAKLDSGTLTSGVSSLTEYLSNDGNHRLYIFRISANAADALAGPSPIPATLNEANLGALAALPDGAIVAIHKWSAGGALSATAPLAASATGSVPQLTWIKAGNSSATVLTGATTVNQTVVTTVGATNGITFSKVTLASGALTAADIDTAYPDTGLLSAELTKWAGRSGIATKDPTGATYAAFTTTAADTAQLTAINTADLIFGIVVTPNLRNALQKAQGLTVGSELEADQPSLTEAQINNIFTGTFTNWSSLQYYDPVTNQTYGLTTFPGVTLPTGGTNIYFARRDNGSGNNVTTQGRLTRKSNNWINPASTDTAPSTFVAAQTRFNFSQTRPVQDTLNLWNGTRLNSSNVVINTTPVWGVGVLSSEKPFQNTTTNVNNRENGIRFVKINGYAPTVLNVATGKYDLWGTTQYAYQLNYLTTRETNAPGTAYLAALFERDLNNPSLIGPIDENLQNNQATAGTSDDWGGGFLTSVGNVSTDIATGTAYQPTIPPSGQALNTNWVLTHAVNPNTHHLSSVTPDNWGPTTQKFQFPEQ